MPAQLDDILEAVQFVSLDGGVSELRAYVCRDDGAVYFHSEYGDCDPLPDDIEDGSKYLAIPTRRDLDLGAPLVFAFIDEFSPEDADVVYGFFRKRGAYARLKNLLQYRGLLEQWYGYEESATESAVSAWCVEHNIFIEHGSR